MSQAADEVDACWSRIGVDGDGSCPELAKVVHCRKCGVYSQAGRRFLEQPAPPGYLDHWATQLAAPAEEIVETLSTVVFRLHGENLALPTTSFVEALEVSPVHRVPHRSDEILLGLVNIRGELHLCVSLAALLLIQPEPDDARRSGRARLAMIEHDGNTWVFPVDDLLGVRRIARRDLGAPPATVVNDASALTAALFDLAGERVALLDADLLFARLQRALT